MIQGNEGLVIDWVNMPTYNTIMALATGAALCSLAYMGKKMLNGQQINPEGWALNLGSLGLLLFPTGLHMTLTWPLAKYFPFDNIVFGEPSLALGILLLAAAFYFWKRAERIKQAESPIREISRIARHFRFLMYGLGLALIAIGIAGVTYGLFAAPPEEPLTGLMADYPMIEAAFISILWALTGVACLLMPGVFDYFSEGNTTVNGMVKTAYGLLYGTGVVFLLFGVLNYFTHIGLIVNTMK